MSTNGRPGEGRVGHSGAFEDVGHLHELAADCVHCGFCLPACPTYLLWGREADSPRGRIYLIKAVLDGRADPGDKGFVRHIDACLGCMSCVTACPSGVQYDRLIEGTRPVVEAQAGRSLWDRAYRQLLFAVFPHPARLRPLAAAVRLFQRTGLQRALRATGLIRLLPSRLRALERLTPTLAAPLQPLPAVVPASPPQRRRVVMLLGCVQREFFPEVNRATARVLAAEGCEVLVPPQGCCGALFLHSGLEDEARHSARRLIDAFDLNAVDHIVVNSAGCGSAMKEYGVLLKSDPEYAERARAFAAKCVDVSELLAGLEPRAPRHPLPWKVAYHDACHLQHAQRIKAAPRQLLAGIPGLELREIAEPDICCGSAGIYNLLEPDAAGALRERKVRNVLKTDCDLLVSSNPGCLMQIASGLEAAGRPLRTAHLVELLDLSIRQQT